MSGAERHLRINHNVIFCLRIVLVEGAVNYASVTDDNGLEKVLFPFFIPVFVFRFGDCIRKRNVFHREVPDHFFQGFFIKQGLLDVGLHSFFVRYKAFEADFGGQGRKNISYGFITRLCDKIHFKVFHTLFVGYVWGYYFVSCSNGYRKECFIGY